MSAPQLPHALAMERSTLLKQRVLPYLPEELLEPLADGLERRVDTLCPGALADGGNVCAVGALLEALFPAFENQSSSRRRFGFFGRRKHSIRDYDHLFDAPITARLHVVEVLFDHGVRAAIEAEPAFTVRAASRAIGMSMAAEVRAELDRRHRHAREMLFVPEEWTAPQRELATTLA